MYIRVFATEDRGVGAYLNFLRLEMPGGRDWRIEFCDPYKWIPTKVADIHLHIDTPVRMAIPWAGFNAVSALYIPSEWGWAHKVANMMVDREALEDRARGIKALRAMIRAAQRHGGKPTLPVPPARGAVPPKIGVITVTKNRAEWWSNMMRNVSTQEWPVSRMEWIIVDDSDDGRTLSSEVAALQAAVPTLKVKYVLLKEGVSIGEKRNMAVREADADTTVFACMDDDDHYPPSSLAVRASWLSRPGTEIAYCSTLPMYDACRYISAMSVPPLDAGPEQRISEASLCFTRAAWEEQPFPDVSMAEGEFFFYDRVDKTVEIPPTGVIVSFIHRGNTSSRRVPEKQEPNGSHYGFTDEYFEWLTRTAGPLS